MKVAEKACQPGDTMHNEPFMVNPMMVFNAIKHANYYASEYKKFHQNQIFKK